MEQNSACASMIRRIHGALEKQANQDMAAQDLTMAQFGALMLLGRAPDGELTLKELEHTLHVAQSTAAGIVSRLEQKGMLAGAIDPDDRRVKRVRLTERGAGCLAAAHLGMEQAETTLLRSLSEPERAEFARLLRKVSDSLK